MQTHTGQALETRRNRDSVTSVQRYVPAVDIVETPDAIIMLADMPGVSAEGVTVNFDRGELSVHGRVQPSAPDSGTLLRAEYGVGNYERRFRIGEGIDHDGIAAEMRAGVLTVTLPKVREQQARKIAVRAAD